jgi:hypothetical protein
LRAKQRLRIARQQVGGVLEDCQAPCPPQLLLGPSAAQQADGPQARLRGGFGVVRRVTDNDRAVRVLVGEASQSRLEDIGVRLALLGVVGGRFGIDQVDDVGDLLVPRQFIFLGRRGKRDLPSAIRRWNSSRTAGKALMRGR